MMKNAIILIFLLSLFGFEAFGQTQIRTKMHDGLLRDYRIHVPPGYIPGTPIPMVINMHGLTSNAFEQEFYSDFTRIAKSDTFIVVYPNGVSNAWNSGIIIGGVDDVGFISLLIDELGAKYSIDLSRVYATGMSNGGFMSYYLACELEDRIAAIASVTGSMMTFVLDDCDVDRPVPVLEIHGTNDLTVPYDGSIVIAAIDSVLSFWVNNNQCNTIPLEMDLPDVVMESSTVTTFSYSECVDSAEVLLYRINNGGHTWPGSPILLSGQNTNQDIVASEIIWEFFSRHHHPNPKPLSTTGISHQTLGKALQVYPNPASDKIKITTSKVGIRIVSLRLMSTTGKLISKYDGLNIDQFEIEKGELPNGIYLLTIETNEGIATKKVVFHNKI